MKILAEKFDEKTLKKKKIISKTKVEREKDRVFADGVSRTRVNEGQVNIILLGIWIC